MKLSFTGTRQGMTEAQQESLRTLLRGQFKQVDEFHHGLARGADIQAAVIVRVRKPRCRIVAHPSDLKDQRAEDIYIVNDETRPPYPPLERNRHIVDEGDVLVAAPRQSHEEQRSGTWAAVRYARKKGKPVIIIWPSGNVQEEDKHV